MKKFTEKEKAVAHERNQLVVLNRNSFFPHFGLPFTQKDSATKIVYASNDLMTLHGSNAEDKKVTETKDRGLLLLDEADDYFFDKTDTESQFDYSR